MESFLFNPAVAVPLGAFSVAIFAIVSGAFSRAHSQRLKAEQRMAMLARGVPMAEIEAVLDSGKDGEQSSIPSSPTRRMANSRTTSLVLISVGLGIALFGLALASITREHDVLVVAATGLIPFAIGVGFLVDYRLQKKDIEQRGA